MLSSIRLETASSKNVAAPVPDSAVVSCTQVFAGIAWPTSWGTALGPSYKPTISQL